MHIYACRAEYIAIGLTSKPLSSLLVKNKHFIDGAFTEVNLKLLSSIDILGKEICELFDRLSTPGRRI